MPWDSKNSTYCSCKRSPIMLNVLFHGFETKSMCPWRVWRLPEYERKDRPLFFSRSTFQKNVCSLKPVRFSSPSSRPRALFHTEHIQLCGHPRPVKTSWISHFLTEADASNTETSKARAKRANCSVVGSEKQHKRLHMLRWREQMKARSINFIFDGIKYGWWQNKTDVL